MRYIRGNNEANNCEYDDLEFRMWLDYRLDLDFKTGEILGYDGEPSEPVYFTKEYKHYEYFTKEDEDYFHISSVAPESFTNKDQLQDLMSGVDGRKLVTYEAAKAIFYQDSGEARLNYKRPEFSKVQYKSINKLIGSLVFRNIIFDTRENIAALLSVNKKNLMRTLKNLGSLVRIYTEKEGIRKGEIKILVSPSYGFKNYSPKHDWCNVNTLRNNAVNEWYTPVSNHDIALAPDSGYQDMIGNDFEANSEKYASFVVKDRQAKDIEEEFLEEPGKAA